MKLIIWMWSLHSPTCHSRSWNRRLLSLTSCLQVRDIYIYIYVCAYASYLQHGSSERGWRNGYFSTDRPIGLYDNLQKYHVTLYNYKKFLTSLEARQLAGHVSLNDLDPQSVQAG